MRAITKEEPSKVTELSITLTPQSPTKASSITMYQMEKATSTIKVATEWKEPGLEELTPQLWSDLIISNYLQYQINSEATL